MRGFLGRFPRRLIGVLATLGALAAGTGQIRGQALYVLRGHTDGVLTVAFSPSGRQVLTAGEDRSIRIWDAEAGVFLGTRGGHSARITALALSPDGKTLAAASWDRTVRLWNTTFWEYRETLGAELRPFVELDGAAFLPDSRTLALLLSGMRVVLLDTQTGAERARFQGEGITPLALAVDPDGTRLAIGTQEHDVLLWDRFASRVVKRLEGHSRKVLAVAFSPDGKRLASGDGQGSVIVWDAAAGTSLTSFRFPDLAEVWGLAFSPDSRLLAVAGKSKTVRLLDVGNRQELARLEGHGSSVTSVAFSPDGKTLASGSWDRTARLWKVPALKEPSR